jgi:N-acetylglucosamine-6-phosphate deacetylase
MQKKYFVKNIVNHDSVLIDCSITINGGTILSVIKEPCPEGQALYEYAIPGFIDIHTHGGNNYELMDDSVEALDEISKFYLRNGTTSFLLSTVTAGLDKIESVLKTASGFMDKNGENASNGLQSGLLGIHLEGPWLSEKNLGAQDPVYCIPPGKESFELIENYQDIIRMVTFSYHTPESEKLLELLLDKGIIPATGHDEAYDERILEGFKKGIKVVTHIYCVTSTFQRRNGLKHLGTIEMGLMTEGVKVEVIADGKHITKYFWDFIKHNKSYEDIIIITDSMRCAGLPEDPGKRYKLGEKDVIIDDGVAWLENKTVFAGSVATMHSTFKRLTGEWNVPLNEAVKITSYNQAKLLNIFDEVGEIKKGKKADILLLDKNMNLHKVIKSGVEADISD